MTVEMTEPFIWPEEPENFEMYAPPVPESIEFRILTIA